MFLQHCLTISLRNVPFQGTDFSIIHYNVNDDLRGETGDLVLHLNSSGEYAYEYIENQVITGQNLLRKNID